MGYALFIFGPAGTGKSTFCSKLVEHGKIIHRQFNLINFDPAQTNTKTDYLIDIRKYITTTEIMEECDFGPNGSLMVAFDELYKNIDEIEIEEYSNEYLIFDFPGQIELFMHTSSMNNIINYFSKFFKISILYFLEGQCVYDVNKFMGNLLCGFISMSRFDYFMFFVFSKVDLVGKEKIENFLENLENLSEGNKMYKKILDLAQVDFKMIDYSDEDSINDLLYWVDNNLQYYDDVDIFQDNE
ncbi:GPN-loop gtpase 3 [Vairimorpha necatrix]|uniref:GPN-loop GTPase 3 n=1 Tax=Vairimorpha necatrix TaxID=6039 RepID=A0AAX4JAR1_9MICR